MKKTLILRNQSGAAIGYIQQMGDMVHLGLSSEETVRYDNLFLQYKNGSMYCRELKRGNIGEKWKEENEITGGYLVYCNQIIADTGKNVRKAAISKPLESLKPSNPKHSESQEQKQSDVRRAFTRWPPNPCDPVNTYSVRMTYSFSDYT